MPNPMFPNIGEAWEHVRPYQFEDTGFAAQHKRVVLGHKTGLGKTFIAMLAWSKWHFARRGLIVGTLASMATWHRIMKQWAGIEPIFMQGVGDPNWPLALSGKYYGVWMCTYQTLLYLMKNVVKPHQVEFDVLINDELHRSMRNRKNQVTRKMSFIDSEYYIGLSATWASRGPQDLWPVLHQINPKRFSSYWRFVSQWCWTDKTNFGTEIYAARNPQGLRKMLWGDYYVARNWKEVSPQFMDKPYEEEPVIRLIVELEMTKEQADLYKQLDEDMVACLGDEMVVTPNSLARLTRCLQIAICPQMLFPSAKVGIAIEWLKDRVQEETHTVIFCPYKAALDILKVELLKDGIPAYRIFTLKGGTRPQDINDIVAAWKKAEGVMLCTIDFAQSFDLDTTMTAYMFGFDWDPNDNLQAEGRLRRMDSVLQVPCLVRYIVVVGTAYEHVKDVVNGKVANTTAYLESRLDDSPKK